MDSHKKQPSTTPLGQEMRLLVCGVRGGLQPEPEIAIGGVEFLYNTVSFAHPRPQN